MKTGGKVEMSEGDARVYSVLQWSVEIVLRVWRTGGRGQCCFNDTEGPMFLRLLVMSSRPTYWH